MAVAVVGVSSIVESSSLSGAELGTDLLFLGVLVVDLPGENGSGRLAAEFVVVVTSFFCAVGTFFGVPLILALTLWGRGIMGEMVTVSLEIVHDTVLGMPFSIPMTLIRPSPASSSWRFSSSERSPSIEAASESGVLAQEAAIER